jgi:flagellin-like protein
MEDKNMKNENENEQAVSPVIATILMVAITVVLAGVLYVWASQLAEGNADGDFSMYKFEVTEAGTTLTASGEEALVRVALEKGDDLSWSQVIVQMKVGDSAFVECTNPDKSVGTECSVSDNDDGEWTFAEDITISEGTNDLCDGQASCEVTIKILDSATQDKIFESGVKKLD